MNKKILTTITGGALLLGGLGASQVFAQETQSSYPPVIQKLAEHFGASEDEVHQVFEEDREQRHEERLNDAVEQGKITEEQRNQLEEMHQEMKMEMERIRNSGLTLEEQRAEMKTLHEQHREWIEENGISLHGMRGNGNGMMQGEGMHRGF